MDFKLNTNKKVLTYFECVFIPMWQCFANTFHIDLGQGTFLQGPLLSTKLVEFSVFKKKTFSYKFPPVLHLLVLEDFFIGFT